MRASKHHNAHAFLRFQLVQDGAPLLAQTVEPSLLRVESLRDGARASAAPAALRPVVAYNGKVFQGPEIEET